VDTWLTEMGMLTGHRDAARRGSGRCGLYPAHLGPDRTARGSDALGGPADECRGVEDGVR